MSCIIRKRRCWLNIGNYIKPDVVPTAQSEDQCVHMSTSACLDRARMNVTAATQPHASKFIKKASLVNCRAVNVP